MTFSELGKWLFIGGIGLMLLGGFIWLLGHIPFFGNLPGDFRIQTQNFTCFFPLASLIVLSLILTIILNIVIRILHK